MDYKRILLLIVGWTIMYYVFFKLLPRLSDKYRPCYDFWEIYDDDFHGLVTKKYMDKSNHNNATIDIVDEHNVLRSESFAIRTLEVYDYLNVGDSIVKQKNTTYYKIRWKSKGKDTIIRYETSCKDTIRK